MRLSTSATQLDIEAGNAPISCELSAEDAVSGSITGKHGPISIVLGDDVSTQLTCETQKGAVAVECDCETTVREPKLVKAAIGSGEGELTIQTNQGPISVK